MLEVEQQTIQTVKNVGPAVVSIIISRLMSQIKKPPFGVSFDPSQGFGIPLPEKPLHDRGLDLPDNQGQRVKVGGGSGFIVNSDGIIVTNKHVVYEPDSEYTVMMSDDKEYSARVLSRDPINDVAILKIEATGLPTVTIGDSDKIELGQTAIAIGNALGLFSNSVSKGIISGLGRKISAQLGQDGQIENLRHVIQTDVAINQGNSGGPLVNLDGKVIGINTAIIYGAQNIGFAIPINWAKRDLEDLMAHGRIIRPYIGVRYVMLNKDLQKQYGLAMDYGALVVKDHIPGSQAVIEDSPADKAGLRENDIILAIDKQNLSDKIELADIIENHEVGDTLSLKVQRHGKVVTCPLQLEERK